MRNFIVLKHTNKEKTLKHYFGSVYTDRGYPEFYCTFCRKFLEDNTKQIEESTKDCPRGEKDYIVLNNLNGLEEVLNCGYELVTVIQDPIETDEY
jgi:hypothetical protein